MTREVYSNKSFGDFSRKQIFVRVFVDTDSEGERLVDRFRVRGYPTIIIFDSSGQEIDRIIGFRRAPELIEELQEIFDGASGKRLKL